MNLKIKAFGITKDILGGREVTLEFSGATVASLRRDLTSRYPELKGLRSLMIAVNNEYAGDDQEIKVSDEIALIPPVSGG